MGKAVLISMQPKWCELISSGKKIVEVRKTKPRLETPFKCYIYATKGEELWKIRKRPFLIVPTYDNRQYVAENEYYSFDEVQGKVIGEFVCDCIEVDDLYSTQFYQGYYDKTACLNQKDLINYGHGERLYFWHISNLVIYDKPKELGEFLIDCKNCNKKFVGDTECWHGCINGYRKITRPPQSWCYVEDGERN